MSASIDRTPPLGVEILDAVRANAALDGISLREIAIKYENLTVDEVQDMDRRGLIGRFADDGEALFPAKATAVFHLAA